MTRTKPRGEAKRWPLFRFSGSLVGSLPRVLVGPSVEVLVEEAAVKGGHVSGRATGSVAT